MRINKLYDALYGDRMVPELQSRMLNGIDPCLSQTSLNSIELMGKGTFPKEYQLLKADISQLGISPFQQPIQVYSNIQYIEYIIGLILDDVIKGLGDDTWKHQIIHSFLHEKDNTESVMIPTGWGKKASYQGTLSIKGIPGTYETQIIQGGSLGSSNYPIRTLPVDELITPEFEHQLHKVIKLYIGKLQQTIQKLTEAELNNIRRKSGTQAS